MLSLVPLCALNLCICADEKSLLKSHLLPRTIRHRNERTLRLEVLRIGALYNCLHRYLSRNILARRPWYITSICHHLIQGRFILGAVKCLQIAADSRTIGLTTLCSERRKILGSMLGLYLDEVPELLHPVALLRCSSEQHHLLFLVTCELPSQICSFGRKQK